MNFKGTGLVPFFAIFCFFSLALGLKLEVEIVTPITKARTLPSASSDPRGFVRKGQTFIVDGQSGEWYRISIYNSFVWIPKDAVKILRSEEEPTSPAAATPAAEGGRQPETPQPGTVTPEHRAGKTLPTAASPPKIGQTITIAQKSTVPETTAALPPTTPVPAPATSAVAAPTPSGPEAPADVKPAQPKENPVNFRPVATVKPYQPPKPAPSHTWFSKRSLFPSQIPLDADGKEILYFQVSNKAVPVFASRSSASATLADAGKGDYFPLLEHDGLWCRISIKDTSGWVELAGGAIVSAPKSGFIDEYMLILIIAAGIVALTLLLIGIFLIRSKTKKKAKGPAKFHGLIIARSDPEVQGAISGKPVPLGKYLSSIGFSVKTARKLNRAQKVVDNQRLEVVFIDWYISDDIPGTVEILFTTIEQKNLPLAIFYNVPKTTEIPLIPVLLRAHHLGASFTDRDISNLLTPTMLSSADKKGGAASALEGDIAEGNLPEIMEFIEIGKKTGALAVETDSPVGVLYFVDGRVVHAAAANGIFGRDAINTLLNLKQGKFRFLLDKLPKVRDLNLSTLEVLMEWTKNEDEAHRN